MKAIETRYKGYRFRSRLEARWAVFFDALGIKWEYEPEGFVSDDGGMYLPDFYLPDVYLRSYKGVYIEIKPRDTRETMDAVFDKLYTTSCDLRYYMNLVLITGTPPGESDLGLETYYEMCNEKFGGMDFPMVFVICHDCGGVKIEFPESNYMQCQLCESHNVWRSGDGIKNDRFNNASNAARSARFEFGECGARV